jgi:hypothetical protein
MSGNTTNAPNTKENALQQYNVKQSVNTYMDETNFFEDVSIGSEGDDFDDDFIQYCVECLLKGVFNSEQPLIPFLDTSFKLIECSLAKENYPQPIEDIIPCLKAIHKEMLKNEPYYTKLMELTKLNNSNKSSNATKEKTPIWKVTGGSMIITDMIALALPLVGIFLAFKRKGTIYKRLQNVQDSWNAVRAYFSNRYWIQKYKIDDLSRIVLIKTKGLIVMNDKVLNDIMRQLPEYIINNYQVLEEGLGRHIDILLYFVLLNNDPSIARRKELNQEQIDFQKRLDAVKKITHTKKHNNVSVDTTTFLSKLKSIFTKKQFGGVSVFILGRDRKVCKVKSMTKVRYMNKLITLKEAQKLDKKVKNTKQNNNRL